MLALVDSVTFEDDGDYFCCLLYVPNPRDKRKVADAVYLQACFIAAKHFPRTIRVCVAFRTLLQAIRSQKWNLSLDLAHDGFVERPKGFSRNPALQMILASRLLDSIRIVLATRKRRVTYPLPRVGP